MVQLGAAGSDRRLEMGDPFGAISCGVGACEAGVLPRVGNVGVSRLPLPPILPPPREVELRLPRSALDSKITIVRGKTRGVSLWRFCSTQSAEWCGSGVLYYRARYLQPPAAICPRDLNFLPYGTVRDPVPI